MFLEKAKMQFNSLEIITFGSFQFKHKRTKGLIVMVTSPHHPGDNHNKINRKNCVKKGNKLEFDFCWEMYRPD